MAMLNLVVHGGQMARYDCFTFFNELDLLEIRLKELSPVVDVFVLCESSRTFQGEPKPLYFGENMSRFRPWLSRIHHVIADEPKAVTDQWTREVHQREALRGGFRDAVPDDLVMVSDVDEIIRAEAVEEAARRGGFSFFGMDMYLYYMNWRASPWLKAYAAPAPQIRALSDLTQPRRVEAAFPHDRIIADAGWHFSWLGGVDRMLEKLGAFSHTEEAVQQWRDPQRLSEAVGRRAFFYDDRPLTQVALGQLPASAREAVERLVELGLISPDHADQSSHPSKSTRR